MRLETSRTFVFPRAAATTHRKIKRSHGASAESVFRVRLHLPAPDAAAAVCAAGSCIPKRSFARRRCKGSEPGQGRIPGKKSLPFRSLSKVCVPAGKRTGCTAPCNNRQQGSVSSKPYKCVCLHTRKRTGKSGPKTERDAAAVRYHSICGRHSFRPSPSALSPILESMPKGYPCCEIRPKRRMQLLAFRKAPVCRSQKLKPAKRRPWQRSAVLFLSWI